MELFEYEVVKYPSKTFMRLVYFCSEKGECSIDEVPGDEAAVLQDLLNSRGAEGWELVQVSFGADGAVAFWKRRKA